ncbi:MAG: YqhA family protein [Leptolyngbyaceae cyanobacterium SM2_3_12]|nr:YqhA family protein [Leptolyngbyaceae cyanobacterium SM2_3_12]
MPRLFAVIQRTRFISVLAVLSSLVGALVMFCIGTFNTFSTILMVVRAEVTVVEGSSIEPSEMATIELLECLDNFLVGLAFLYFAYGIYSLFIQLGRKDSNAPAWLRISNIGILKKTLLELLVVLLTVVFVKGLLERLSFRGLEWTYLVIPLSILAIAASTRLLQFDDEAPAKEVDK